MGTVRFGAKIVRWGWGGARKHHVTITCSVDMVVWVVLIVGGGGGVSRNNNVFCWLVGMGDVINLFQKSIQY